MEKNWLIRTTQLNILGPVSREKIKELLKKKSIGEDDELCSGNGHWFAVKEKEFLERYIYQEEKPGLNPLSSAQVPLSSKQKSSFASPSTATAPTAPTTATATAPTAPAPQTPTSAADTNNKSPEEQQLPSKDDLEYPDITVLDSSLKKKLK